MTRSFYKSTTWSTTYISKLRKRFQRTLMDKRAPARDREVKGSCEWPLVTIASHVRSRVWEKGSSDGNQGFYCNLWYMSFQLILLLVFLYWPTEEILCPTPLLGAAPERTKSCRIQGESPTPSLITNELAQASPGYTNGQIDGWMDVWTKILPVFHRTLSLLGPLPCSHKGHHKIPDQSRARVPMAIFCLWATGTSWYKSELSYAIIGCPPFPIISKATRSRVVMIGTVASHCNGSQGTNSSMQLQDFFHYIAYVEFYY